MPLRWRLIAVLTAALVVGCVDASQREAPHSRTPLMPQKRDANILGAPIEPLTPGRSGALVLGRIGGKLHAFVADADENAIIIVDVDENRELTRTALGGRPEHVLIGTQGHVFVTVASTAQVRQLVLSGERLVERAVTEVPAEPAAMTETSDGNLLVTSRWGAALSVLDRDTLGLESLIPLERDPYGVVMLQGGGQALVTHVVGGRLSVVDIESGSVNLLDASRKDVKTHRRSKYMRSTSRPSVVIHAHRRAVQAYAASRTDDGRVLVSASLADGSPALGKSGYGGGGGGVVPHMGVELVVDAGGKTVNVPHGSARTRSRDCLLPRASAWDAANKVVLVACAGTDRVSAFDRDGRVVFDAPVPEGPTGIALDVVGRRWLSWSQFAGALSVGELDARSPNMTNAPTASIALTRHSPLPPRVARGRLLFHEAGSKSRVSADGRACASCHPGGRDDGVTWHTNEGPRQTPIIMARIQGTAPYGWNGRAKDMDVCLQTTVRRLEGTVDKAERADLIAYLHHMAPPEIRPSKDELIARGRALFVEHDRCSSCHSPEESTSDGLKHDIGSGSMDEWLTEFNTPSLKFVSKSAPYYHDGRYPSLEAHLADPNTGMGAHADLDPQDRAAMAAFLRTL